MVRKFVVRVNGKEYIVEVEELGMQTQVPVQSVAQQIQVTQPVQTVQTQQPTQPVQAIKTVQAVQEESRQAQMSSTSSGVKIVAPMSGVILKVLVSEGQKVEYGQKVVILEAMKMENEIVADKSGIVKKIHVKEGDNVDTGQVLVELG